MVIKDILKNKKIVIGASIAVLAIAVGFGTYALNVKKVTEQWTAVIYPGVKVNNLDLSGKTKEEATELIHSNFSNEVINKKLNVTVAGKTYVIDYSKINAHYDVEATVNEAMNYGKGQSMFDKYDIIKNSTEKTLKLVFVYDETYVNEIVSKIEKDNNKEPVNATIEVESGNITVENEQNGYTILKDKLVEDIKSNINGDIVNDVTIEAPGEVVQASVTADKLKTVNAKISSYETSFKTSSDERSSNINLAAKSINGTVVMPGETFSFNGVVGERTAARGYKEAHVIINAQIESGLGGGICQVSSTLYNALLRTELSTSEMDRTPHTLPSTYVPKGLDATVDWGNIDYKFKNTLDYPVVIQGYTQNKVLYFNVYSNSSYANRTYNLISNVYETVATTTKTVQDSSLAEGQTVEDKKAYQGYRVKVTKQTLEGGNVIKSEELYSDYYRPVTGVVRVGTKK